MKRPFFLAVAAIAIFSACTSSNQDVKKDLSPADKLLDEKLYSEALDIQDAAKCIKIISKELQKECADVINALKITEKAVANSDTKACGEITLSRYRENCEAEVEEKLIQAENQKNLEKELQKNDEIDSQAFEKDDESLCEEIGDENQRNSCYYNVLTNRALDKKDTSICAKISAKDMMENCQNVVKGLN